MSEQAVIVIGAGGHAKVLADALLAAGETVLGFTEAQPDLWGSALLGLPVLGDDTVLDRHDPSAVRLANGIGGVACDPLRERVQRRLEAQGWRFATVRHPSAIVSAHAEIAESAQLLARCVVQAGARIGAGAIVNTAAVVEHDVQLGAFVHVAPGAVVCGDVAIGEGSHIGAGATVRQGLRLGPQTLVGVGAAVVRNHEGGGVLAGVPAAPRTSR